MTTKSRETLQRIAARSIAARTYCQAGEILPLVEEHGEETALGAALLSRACALTPRGVLDVLGRYRNPNSPPLEDSLFNGLCKAKTTVLTIDPNGLQLILEQEVPLHTCPCGAPIARHEVQNGDRYAFHSAADETLGRNPILVPGVRTRKSTCKNGCVSTHSEPRVPRKADAPPALEEGLDRLDALADAGRQDEVQDAIDAKEPWISREDWPEDIDAEIRPFLVNAEKVSPGLPKVYHRAARPTPESIQADRKALSAAVRVRVRSCMRHPPSENGLVRYLDDETITVAVMPDGTEIGLENVVAVKWERRAGEAAVVTIDLIDVDVDVEASVIRETLPGLQPACLEHGEQVVCEACEHVVNVGEAFAGGPAVFVQETHRSTAPAPDGSGA